MPLEAKKKHDLLMLIVALAINVNLHFGLMQSCYHATVRVLYKPKILTYKAEQIQNWDSLIKPSYVIICLVSNVETSRLNLKTESQGT